MENTKYILIDVSKEVLEREAEFYLNTAKIEMSDIAIEKNLDKAKAILMAKNIVALAQYSSVDGSIDKKETIEKIRALEGNYKAPLLGSAYQELQYIISEIF